MLHLPCRVLASLAVGTALCAGSAKAEITPTLNINGGTGLIELPSGDAQTDGKFTFSGSLIDTVVARGTRQLSVQREVVGLVPVPDLA
jgi:hypothetical protein